MIKVFEAFAGYGSQSLALERLNIPHEVVCISEIDKYAIKAYEALHGAVRNLGDISKINEFEVPEHDLFTYSFPCQDISVAGLQKGITESTRSGLLWECERIIKAKKLYKEQQRAYKAMIKLYPHLKLHPLSQYLDYNEVKNIEQHLTYRLGNLLVKHPFTFIFRARKVYKEWKKEKKR